MAIMMVTGISVIVHGLLCRLSLTDRLDSLGKLLRLPSKDDVDREVNEFLTAEINPAEVVLEVGANRGGLTRLLSGLVGRDGLVVAIEPEWTNMGRLASVVGASPNVSLVDAVLSNSDGDASLYVSDTDATGRAYSLAASRTSSRRTTNVPTVRGDSLARRGLAAAPTFWSSMAKEPKIWFWRD
jgi:FkbM family methyltransferase